MIVMLIECSQSTRFAQKMVLEPRAKCVRPIRKLPDSQCVREPFVISFHTFAYLQYRTPAPVDPTPAPVDP